MAVIAADPNLEDVADTRLMGAVDSLNEQAYYDAGVEAEDEEEADHKTALPG